MNGVSSVGQAQPRTDAQVSGATRAQGSQASLLPASEGFGAAGGMAALYQVLSMLRDNQLQTSTTAVHAGEAQRKVDEHKREEALQKAREAAEKGGVFDWISKDIGLAGVVGLVTFNYPLVAADVAAHKAGLVKNMKIDLVDVGVAGATLATGGVGFAAADLVLRKTELAPKEARDLLEKLGIPKDAPGISDEDVKPIAKKVLMANLAVASVAATVLSAGTTSGLFVGLAGLAISAGGAYVAKEKALDGVLGEGWSAKIGLGMEIFGAAAAGMSGLATGGAALPWADGAGKVAAGIASGTSSALHGTDQIVMAAHEHEADEHKIEAEQMKLKLRRLERFMDFVIDGAKEAYESGQRAMESVQGAIETLDKTHVALAQGVRG